MFLALVFVSIVRLPHNARFVCRPFVDQLCPDKHSILRQLASVHYTINQESCILMAIELVQKQWFADQVYMYTYIYTCIYAYICIYNIYYIKLLITLFITIKFEEKAITIMIV